LVDRFTLCEFNSQAIEGVKLCLATDKHLFNEVFESLGGLYDAPAPGLTSFIEKMIKAKIAVVEKDLTEDHYGMSMLYGHTVGHAIEMLDHDNINHGEGVGLGMLVAARISCMLGLADESLVTTHEEVLMSLGLPSKIPSHISPTDIIEKLGHNKKNYGGEIRFVLLKGIGQMANNNEDYFNVVPSEVISAAIGKGY
jgi:3-dehydroquinate synthase